MFRPIRPFNNVEVGLVPPGVGTYIVYKAKRPFLIGRGHIRERLWNLLHGMGDSSLLMAGKGELTFEYVYLNSIDRVERIAAKEIGANALLNCRRQPDAAGR